MVYVAFALIVSVAASVGGFNFLFLSPAQKAVASGPTTINFSGNNIQQLTVITAAPGAQTPTAQPATVETIVENGDFEHGLTGWGTGWFESHFPHLGVAALAFNGALAQWSLDDRKAHSGRFALRIDHATGYSPHVFSSFSQQIRVKPGRRYQVKFWAYLDASDAAAFSLRIVPSRKIQPNEWDKFKAKLDSASIARWQEVRQEFDSGSDRFFDLRFAAEAVLTVWVDDVSVASLD
jgi:hypothetical protein